MTSLRRPESRQPAASDATAFQVLNLVTNDGSQFYNHQLDVLEAQGVRQTTVAVPGHNERASTSVEGDNTRSLLDYARFLPRVVAHSFGTYDLLHANFGLTGPAALVQPRLPVVLSLWGTDLMGKYGWVTRRCTPHVDAVIVMSERMAAELDRDCYVIPHGVNLDLFAPRPQADAQAEIGWASSKQHIMFPYPTGRPIKNYPRAERVAEAAIDAVDDDVAFHTISGVDHADMPTYMNAADVLLLTSRREGSPNTVKEAMACNLPVVTTDVGDVRERLDGVTHSTVATTDEELVAGLVAALEAGERSNGREHARDLGLARMGERIRGVYEDVLTGTAK